MGDGDRPRADDGGAGDGARRRRRRRRGAPTARRGRTSDDSGTERGAGAQVARSTRSEAAPIGGSKGSKARSGKARGGKARGAKAKSAKAKSAKAKSAKAKNSTSAGRTSKKPRRPRRKAPSVPTKREISAGGVVYRREGEDIEIVLASRRTRRGELAWGLAKGGIEDGESMETAAVREVREETGLRAEIEASLGETRYFYVWENVRIRKTVHFFLMRHVGGDVDERDDEMEEIRWFPLERALKRAAYRGERDVIGRAAELLR